MKLLATRPSEAGGIAGAVALLIAHFAGLTDPNVVVYLAVVVGFVPTAITWLVETVRGRQDSQGGGP